MRTNRRLCLAAAALISGLALFAGTAAASRLEIPNFERGFRIFNPVWIEIGPAIRIECNLTLEGSFHRRTFPKTERLLIGYITAAEMGLGSCTENWIPEELRSTLPWHLQYRGFTGSLPNITGVLFRFVGVSLSIEKALVGGCLIRTTETAPLTGRASVASGELSEFRFEASTIPTSTERFCPEASATIEGRVSITVLGSTSRIRLRLI